MYFVKVLKAAALAPKPCQERHSGAPLAALSSQEKARSAEGGQEVEQEKAVGLLRAWC